MRKFSLYAEPHFHPPLKLSLFVRMHELESLRDELGNINVLPKKQKKAWIIEHRDYLEQALDIFGQYIPSSVDDIDADPQLMNMVMEYTSTLNEVMDLAEVFFVPQDKVR